MPASNVHLRVTRSTTASRSKAVTKTKIPHKSKADPVSSPGWVTGHPDLFPMPLSPRRPNTRRSSVYQRVCSPSRYKNAKVPASNCRNSRQTKNISNNSPSRAGVMTRSRRSSVYQAKATPLLLTRMSPPPQPPVRSSSRRSTAGSTSSKESTSSKQSSSSKGSQSSKEPESTLVFRKPINVLSSDYDMSTDVPVEEMPMPEAMQETVCPSAVSMQTVEHSITASVKSDAVTQSTDSLFPQETNVVSVSPTLSDEFIFPSLSDTDISFNTSRNELATPRSKRFLEEIDASRSPRVTQSFHPTPSKKPKLSLPTAATSEKLLRTRESRFSGVSLSVKNSDYSSSQMSSSFCDAPQTRSQMTPSRSLREMTLKDIANCSSRLDSSSHLDNFQTPVARRSMLETDSQSIFETPRCSDASDENDRSASQVDEIGLAETTPISQPSSSSRCIIL